MICIFSNDTCWGVFPEKNQQLRSERDLAVRRLRQVVQYHFHFHWIKNDYVFEVRSTRSQMALSPSPTLGIER